MSRSSKPPTSGDADTQNTILVVEDNADLRFALREILCEDGYHVLEAGTADDAFLAVASYPSWVGLALLDVVLPEMGGLELGRRLIQRDASIEVIYTSAFTVPLERRHELGITHFLEKPFEPDALIDLVRRLLSNRARVFARGAPSNDPRAG